MTQGDSEAVQCPACQAPIWNPLRNDGEPAAGELSEFVEPCPHCKEPIRFWARWQIHVEAEVDSKTV